MIAPIDDDGNDCAIDWESSPVFQQALKTLSLMQYDQDARSYEDRFCRAMAMVASASAEFAISWMLANADADVSTTVLGETSNDLYTKLFESLRETVREVMLNHAHGRK